MGSEFVGSRPCTLSCSSCCLRSARKLICVEGESLAGRTLRGELWSIEISLQVTENLRNLVELGCSHVSLLWGFEWVFERTFSRLLRKHCGLRGVGGSCVEKGAQGVGLPRRHDDQGAPQWGLTSARVHSLTSRCVRIRLQVQVGIYSACTWSECSSRY